MAIVVNSGTSALQLALRAAEIEDGNEVILPSFSFMAVTNAVLAARAVPVFVDIDPSTLNLNPARLEPLQRERGPSLWSIHLASLRQWKMSVLLPENTDCQLLKTHAQQ